MQMKQKRCGLFRTTPKISNTDEQQTRIVHFVESGKHVKPICTFSATLLSVQDVIDSH